MEKRHILCYGDSNTHGYSAETGGRFDDDTRWTRVLQKELGSDVLVFE
ncbi:MAG: lipolytic enzyme, G-D-S-L, partial [Ruthenibacterium sp.]